MPMQEHPAADDRLVNTEKKKHFNTGHDGMREIDGFLIDAVGSETGDIGGNTCATDESELSMVHEGSSVGIEQGNIYLGTYCALHDDLGEIVSLELDGAKWAIPV